MTKIFIVILQKPNSCYWVITCDNGSTALDPTRIASGRRDVPSGIVFQNAKMGVEDTAFASGPTFFRSIKEIYGDIPCT